MLAGNKKFNKIICGFAYERMENKQVGGYKQSNKQLEIFLFCFGKNKQLKGNNGCSWRGKVCKNL